MLFRSTFLGQASGSLAGTTFSHNKGGQYTRARSIPVNPNSPAQTAVRQNVSGAAQFWRSLSVVGRKGWDNYASGTPVVNAIGDSITLSGWNWFVRSFVTAQLADAGSFVGTAPSTPGIYTVGVTGVTASALSGVTFAFDGTPPDFGLIFLSPPLSVGQNSVKHPLSLASANGSDPLGAIALTRVSFPYGPVNAGQRRVIRFTGYHFGENKTTNDFIQIVTFGA